MDDKTVARVEKLRETEQRSMSKMIAILVEEALDRRDRGGRISAMVQEELDARDGKNAGAA